MQYRCYTCAWVFADGPPPLEALTDQQMGLVQGPRQEANDVRLMLIGSVFDGLGAANFCTDCLLAIVDNPRAFRQEDRVHDLLQDPNAIWCRCGTTYWTSDKDRTKRGSSFYTSGPDWVEVNRLRMRHISDAG